MMARIITEEKKMKENIYQTQHDYEQEQIEQRELEAHERRECPGAPRCGYCLDEQQLQEELEKTEGYYDLNGHWRKP
jgi:hypothetical protein